MTFDYDIQLKAISFIAIFSRFSGFMMALPIYANRLIAVKYKVLLIAACSIIMIGVLPPDWGDNLNNNMISLPYLALISGGELFLGLIVSLQVRVLSEAINIGGATLGRNMGLAMAQEFDPSMEVKSTIMSVILNQVLIMLIFVTGMHIDFILIAASSLKSISPGGFMITEAQGWDILSLVGYMFRTGFKIALPVVCLIIFVNVALALMTKFAQDFQVMMLALPIRIGVGLIVTISGVPVFITVAKGILELIKIRMLDSIGA